MMYRFWTALAVVGALASCGGNPLGNAPTPGGGSGGGTTGSTTVPAKEKGHLNSASYVPGNSTIKINMTSQDATAINATYTRNAAFDVAGYRAYTYQASSSNRYVVALVKSTSHIKGLVAVEGGQFANYHGGGDFVRIGVFTKPSAGVAGPYNYSGSYVGMMNIGTPVPGPGGDLDPTRAYRTVGRALITADFTEMSVSGGVDNRRIVDPLVAPLTDPKLATISLFETPITTAGSFEGKVKIGTQDVGDYAGLFGGSGATDVATLLVFNPYSSSDIFEHGLIVLNNCRDAGGAACP